jgi:hypothetical protein
LENGLDEGAVGGSAGGFVGDALVLAMQGWLIVEHPSRQLELALGFAFQGLNLLQVGRFQAGAANGGRTAERASTEASSVPQPSTGEPLECVDLPRRQGEASNVAIAHRGDKW